MLLFYLLIHSLTHILNSRINCRQTKGDQ